MIWTIDQDVYEKRSEGGLVKRTYLITRYKIFGITISKRKIRMK